MKAGVTRDRKNTLNCLRHSQVRGRVSLPKDKTKLIREDHVRAIMGQAGIDAEETEKFLKTCNSRLRDPN